ncbi:MAG: DNA translocase FtsK, partial [Isosphaeraceae bacterium]
GLVGDDPERNARSALEGLDSHPDAVRTALRRHAYDVLVGPRIQQDRVQLRGQGEALLKFWEAVESLCDWLARLPGLTEIALPEVPLSRTFEDPGWTGPVTLHGVADAVLRVAPGRWCVVELKLGRNAPEADLAQALLYHLMLSNEREPAGDVALVRFGPEREERVFRADQVESARPALFKLIGGLAGVLEGRQRPTAPPIDQDQDALGERLVAALAEHDVQVRLDGPPVVGPAFIRFSLTLEHGVKVAAIQNRAKELRVRLGLGASPRIEIDGSRVVVDVQRADRQTLPFDAIQSEFLRDVDPEVGSSRVPVGVGLDGSLTVADLSRPEHAHVLVAGTTGSGKSEWLRSAIAGLILANTPETLRLVLIDPKRNAFSWLRSSPFLLRPIVHPPEKLASEALAELIEEMESRYRKLESSGSDTIEDHVRKTGQTLPRIVCVCDEYADLIRGDKAERELLESQITRLGAKARASGIHLILATQQPSRAVIKGAIDANVPARVGLFMNRHLESQMLLGQSGAETLLGRGDLLFKDVGEPVRLQAALLNDDQRDQLARRGGASVRV